MALNMERCHSATVPELIVVLLITRVWRPDYHVQYQAAGAGVGGLEGADDDDDDDVPDLVENFEATAAAEEEAK